MTLSMVLGCSTHLCFKAARVNNTTWNGKSHSLPLGFLRREEKLAGCIFIFNVMKNPLSTVGGALLAPQICSTCPAPSTALTISLAVPLVLITCYQSTRPLPCFILLPVPLLRLPASTVVPGSVLHDELSHPRPPLRDKQVHNSQVFHFHSLRYHPQHMNQKDTQKALCVCSLKVEHAFFTQWF